MVSVTIVPALLTKTEVVSELVDADAVCVPPDISLGRVASALFGELVEFSTLERPRSMRAIMGC